MFDLPDPLKRVTRSRGPRRSGAAMALARDTRGVAAVELALATPFMTLLMMGVFDLGNFAYDTMEVNAAACAGAQAAVAAVQNGQACTNSVITTAETSATPLGASIATSGTGQGQGPNCAYSGYVNTTTNNSVTTSTLSSTCSGTCATPGQYAVAYAKLSFSPLLSWSGLVLPSTISTTATVRYG